MHPQKITARVPISKHGNPTSMQACRYIPTKHVINMTTYLLNQGTPMLVLLSGWQWRSSFATTSTVYTMVYLPSASIAPRENNNTKIRPGTTCCFSFGLVGCIDMSQLSAALETWLYTAAMFIMTTMVYKDREETMLRHHHCVCFMFL